MSHKCLTPFFHTQMNQPNLTAAATLGDINPLMVRINELESLIWRLASVSKHILENGLNSAESPKLTKEAYKISEVRTLTGLSKSTIRNKVLSGEILKLEASSVGVVLIPKSEVERLRELKNAVIEKEAADQKLFEEIANKQIDGISKSKKRRF